MKRFVVGGVCLTLLFGIGWLVYPTLTSAQTVDELQQQLNDQQKILDEANQKVKDFQNKLQAKKSEARTLNDQIGLLDDSIETVQLNIEQTTAQINKTNTQVKSVQKQIEEKERQIVNQKELLGQYIRAIDALDSQSSVAILLKYQTFAEAMSETSTVINLQNRAQLSLTTIQQLRDELAQKQQDLKDYQASLTGLQTRQQTQKTTLDSQKGAKQHLLDLTNAQASQYKGLLAEAQRSELAAQAQITQLDASIRAQLAAEGKGNLPGVGELDWPITPIFGVSCPFHCAGYPFAYLIGPHTGTDIPTYVGTPIKAPADGYIGKLHNSGGAGYSYILMIHGSNISTVYGHVSGFANVHEGQLVTRGTVIGYTGGAPGAHGSGLSSGAHLHFEVRLNDAPVDAQKYLPPL